MVIMTAKVSKRKILLIGLLIILAVVLLITCLKKSSGSDTPPDTAEEITEVATNEAVERSLLGTQSAKSDFNH